MVVALEYGGSGFFFGFGWVGVRKDVNRVLFLRKRYGDCFFVFFVFCGGWVVDVGVLVNGLIKMKGRFL